MKNKIVCDNCSYENDFFRITCDECGSYIRNRVVNLNLGEVLWGLIESPLKTFENIIHAEYKNYIIIFSFLTYFEYLISALVLSNYSPTQTSEAITEPSFSVGFALLYNFAFLIFMPLLITGINKLFKLNTRFADNYSIYLYSLAPAFISFLFLFPAGYAIFGVSYFNHSGFSPFDLKPTEAYIFAVIEGLIVLWSVFLSVIATYSQSRNVLYSILIGLLFGAGYWVLIFFAPVNPV